MPKKPKVQKKQDCTDLESQISRINSDLMRIEPIRKAIDKKSLDLMFIMDCTGSMIPWIDTARREIRSIINCLKNQFFNLKIRVSFVGYRDYSVEGGEANMYSIFDFNTNIESCL